MGFSYGINYLDKASFKKFRQLSINHPYLFLIFQWIKLFRQGIYPSIHSLVR